MMRARPAPSARRTASSRCRATPRASIRPATLMHAIKQHDARDDCENPQRQRACSCAASRVRARQESTAIVDLGGDVRLEAAVRELARRTPPAARPVAASVPPVTRAISRTQYAFGAREQRLSRAVHSGEIIGCFAIAMVTSVGGDEAALRQARGSRAAVTPTISTGTSFTRIVLPSTSRSLPNNRVHRPWLITATSGAPAASSSVGQSAAEREAAAGPS